MTEEQRKALEEKLKNMSPEELANLQKQQCIFCQIVSGKIPAKKVFEDEKCLAIIDINPAAKGHLLLLPKEHYAIMPQVPAPLLDHLTITSKKLSQVMLRALKVSGTNIFIANGLAAGQRSQHFMIHIIPRKEVDRIMDWDEKLIAKDYQKQILSLVESKLYPLMGLNLPERTIHPTFTAEDEIPAETPIRKPKVEEKTKEKKAVKKPTPKKEPSEKQSELQSNNTSEQQNEDETSKTESTSEQKSESPSNSPKNPRREDVSLDDIANLFK